MSLTDDDLTAKQAHRLEVEAARERDEESPDDRR